MTSIQPPGESMRRAIRFVSEALQENPERALAALVDEATLRFDLDPKQAEFLIDFQRRARQSK